jgi:hypothetical protein
VLGGLLVAVLGVGLPAPAAAQFDPDPEPDPFLITLGVGPYGTVNLYPGEVFCWDPLQATSSAQYQVYVSANLGNPKVRITVWHWTRRNGSDAVRLTRVKATGWPAFSQTYSGGGYYQICANYPEAQTVAPGDPGDHMWVGTVAVWS